MKYNRYRIDSIIYYYSYIYFYMFFLFKIYCYALKHYLEYLEKINIDYRKANINILSDFVGWLRNPYENNKVIRLKSTEAKRREKTVNLIITIITNFYDCLFRREEIDNDMVDKLMKQVFTGENRRYKDFLYHVNKDKLSNKKILRKSHLKDISYTDL